VTYNIEEGERVAIVGPNGAGKSTLLHLTSGLESPTKGTVKIRGEEPFGRKRKKLPVSVGLLFQDPNDQLFMPTLIEDVAFGPLNQGLSEKEAARKAMDALMIMGLEGFENRRPHQLSIGEKKRAALAGVVAMDPEVLLLDEPTANLDAEAKRQFLDILKRTDSTLVIATHDLELALETSDRVVVLRRKKLFDGSFDDLIRKRNILERANLELPSFMRLFEELRPQHDPAPRTVREAVELVRAR